MKNLIGQLAGEEGLTIMTSFLNSPALACNALGGVSQFQYVPLKTTILVNLIIMNLFLFFSKELPTWPDTLLKTLKKHLCF
jgi:hypothetical protein